MERTLKVTGKGRLLVKPDRIRLCLTCEDTCREYDRVLKMSGETTEALKDVFESLGFDRKQLKTLHFNIETVYESYQDSSNAWKRRFDGYKYVHRMKIEFDADNGLLGKVLYALSHCPAEPEFTIEYTVADPEKCKNELLAKAVRDSGEKAAVLADAAGVKLGNIVAIDYSWGEIDFVTRPVNELMMKRSEIACAPARAYNIDIEADDIDVSDTVTVVWKIGS